MSDKKLSLIAGGSYLVIFFAAIFANFFVLDKLTKNPVLTVVENSMTVRFGIIAFLVTVVFDVVVAWALLNLYKQNTLSTLSTYFRLMHAAIMGVAVFALPLVFNLNTAEAILNQVNIFNTIWLIGLFFFGFHLILLGKIIKTPRFIAIFLMVAGVMYIIDTCAHFLMPNYSNYASLFLALVAVPSIIGEMSFAIYLIVKGINSKSHIRI